jgi:hypothetical protein
MSAALTPIYRSSDQIAQLVLEFETRSLAPSQFNHHAHLTVALWYLARMPFADATATMRSNIQHFAASHHQSQLYHETITMFWMRLLHHVLDTAGPNALIADVVYRALCRFGSMQPFFQHYSRERAFSTEARQQWVEPDLSPLPFGDPSQ